ncbi:sensor histidine kinase [Aestuariivita sp.]|jgi:two-component sensor histidine kinase|uniref:sensor histidine kinase n=1 Tax=Aestuariivita sp. TaxID=1872407 RepID=UPI00216D5BE5|nr:sensor histidine kinase [Aestuariivita sp.]MCE8007430.1 sensor histidine kinase [Aestuariivita sp.]
MTQSVALHRRLTTRVLFFLTLALLPLGVIGVFQNLRLSAEVEQRTELSLLALTERAASGERQIIQRAFGAAQSLSGIGTEVLNDIARCRDYVRRFKASDTNFAFAGFVGVDGTSTCSTAYDVLDFSDYPGFADLIAYPRLSVQVNLNAPGSGQSVMIINQPHFADEVFLGYISLSLPLRDVGETFDFLGDADPIALVTFNAEGQLLSTEQGRARAQRFLPRDISLNSLAHGRARTLIATSTVGQDVVYSIVPIVPDVVYAMGAWPRSTLTMSGQMAPFATVALPFLMWLASLLVVWFVTDRLVIQHIQKLNLAVRRFAKDRKVPVDPQRRATPTELAELETALHGMTHDILQDEARLEDQLREKSVLLKEVHHRVKNNLQIISSIMNMQIRKARAEETKRALGQVQDRIMGLSGVHRTLYQADSLTQVNAATLIEQILEQSRAIGAAHESDIAIETALDAVTVFPDQAVPLAMFVSEALTNAMKYLGGDAPSIRLSLTHDDQNHARLTIENSKGTPQRDIHPDREETSTGLGQQLIRAFATQLGGQIEVSETDAQYCLSLDFTVEEFREDPLDY